MQDQSAAPQITQTLVLIVAEHLRFVMKSSVRHCHKGHNGHLWNQESGYWGGLVSVHK
jgi:hypothetical protein